MKEIYRPDLKAHIMTDVANRVEPFGTPKRIGRVRPEAG